MSKRAPTPAQRRRSPLYREEYFGGETQWRYRCLGCPSRAGVPTLVAGAVVTCRFCGCRVTLAQENPGRETRPWEPKREYWFALDGGGNGEGTVKAQDIYVALRARHPEPDWVLLP